IIAHVSGEERLLGVVRGRERGTAFHEDLVVARASAPLPHELVVRDAIEPGRWVFGDLSARPRLDSGQQGELNGGLDGLELVHADSPREHRDESAVLVPEKIRLEDGVHPGDWISMTSTPDPGLTRPGHALATRMASSRLAAATTM